ncbi:MAG: amidohydrolase family protein [Candidatus Hodarchaeales archaeon]|jgi:5-methylthioadenosine/S-adenosylhomocysteine deaminase
MEILLNEIGLITDPYVGYNNKPINIVIEDTRITEIGKKVKIPDPEYKIAGKSLIALPPPINSHTHLPMTLLRGYSDNKELYDWLQEDIWPIESKMNDYWIILGSKLACLEMIKSGTGGVLDMYFQEKLIGKEIAEAGIRGWLGSCLLPSAFVEQGGLNSQLSDFSQILQLAQKTPLLTACIAPHSQTTVDEDQILNARDKAQKNNVPITIHASETRKEVLACEEKFGIPPVERLDQIGFFQDVEAIIAHCAWITQREVEILGKHKATVAWCPTSAQKLAYGGVTPIPEIRKTDAQVALGTDGTASNNVLDLWREMREGVNLISFERWDPTSYRASEVLHDTVWSFRKKFLPNTLIEEGNHADLVVIDFNAPHLQPHLNNSVSHLVYSANGSDTHSLIVNGNLIMKERNVLTLDEKSIIEEVSSKIQNLLNN